MSLKKFLSLEPSESNGWNSLQLNMPSVDRRRLVVTGTHSSGKNYVSRVLHQLGFRYFLNEPLNPLSPPGIWLGNKDCVYTYCDRESAESKQAMLERKLRSVSGLPFIAGPRSIRDYAALWKAALSRVVLWNSGRSFVIKDPFCLFVADLLKTRLHMSPWIIIRHPADFVANCVRNKVPADFRSFEWDLEFRDRLGGFFDDVRGYACGPDHSDDFHQNIAYWMVCAKVALDSCARWRDEGGYALTLLDTLNADPEQTFARALAQCGVSFEFGMVSQALDAAQAGGSFRGLSRLQQTQDILNKPSAEERLTPLTPAMLEQIEEVTGDLYQQLQALEVRI